MSEAVKQKNIFPIHTFGGSEYRKLFKEDVVELKDGEVISVV